MSDTGLSPAEREQLQKALEENLRCGRNDGPQWTNKTDPDVIEQHVDVALRSLGMHTRRTYHVPADGEPICDCKETATTEWVRVPVDRYPEYQWCELCRSVWSPPE